jgi:hypothetical protein
MIELHGMKNINIEESILCVSISLNEICCYSAVTVSTEEWEKSPKVSHQFVLATTCYKSFITDNCMYKGKSTGKQSVSAGQVETIQQSFLCSPHKSVWHASKKLNIPKTTQWQVLWKRHLYRL